MLLAHSIVDVPVSDCSHLSESQRRVLFEQIAYVVATRSHYPAQGFVLTPRPSRQQQTTSPLLSRLLYVKHVAPLSPH